ncbi:hypothetical protein [Roseateles sp.]|uniref:hypothetical protein n=1 Tax=Roseateles sp. TaxID=1971397 RepID=UPI00286C1246|nr:hypothetical protein [Roseateles sp.]
MKKFTCYAAAIAAVVVLGACASAGTEALRKESESSVQQKMAVGKTTKAEVRAMFGSPIKTTFTDNGLEVWNFEFSNVSADALSYVPIVNMFGGSASGKKKELVVLFDEKDVVKRFAMSEADVVHKTGIFNQ